MKPEIPECALGCKDWLECMHVPGAEMNMKETSFIGVRVERMRICIFAYGGFCWILTVDD